MTTASKDIPRIQNGEIPVSPFFSPLFAPFLTLWPCKCQSLSTKIRCWNGSEKVGKAKECAERYSMGIITWWRRKVKEGVLPRPVRFGRGYTAWDIAECDRFFEENKGK